ncbi:MAG: DNA translocase FtsK [Treponema sp.]|nr:DNA translocase FtsK [Treponema sp.]
MIVIEWLGIGIIADKLNNKTSRPAAKKVDNEVKEENKKSSVFDELLAEVSPDSSSRIFDDEDEEDDVDAETVESELDEDASVEAAEANADADVAAPTAPLLTQEEYAALTTPADDLSWNLPPAPESLPPEYDEDFDENDPALEFPPKEESVEVEEATSETEEAPADYEAEESEEVEEAEEVSSPVEAAAPAFQAEDTFIEDYEGDEEDDPEDDVSPAFDLGFEEAETDQAEESEEKKTSNQFDEVVEEESPYFEADIKSSPAFSNNLDDDFIEWPEDAEEDEDSVKIEENAYSAARYIDTVVENPNFPHGITIHEADEESEEEEEEAPQVAKPKYPSRINLQDSPDEEEDFEDTYVEDETLPFPAFDLDEPAINQSEKSSYQPLPSAIPDTPIRREPVEKPAATPATAPAARTVPVQEAAPAANRPVPHTQAAPVAAAPVSASPARSEEKATISSAASNVFSDMENEIREEQAKNQAASQELPVSQEPSPAQVAPVAARPASAQVQVAPAAPKQAEVDFEGNVISHDSAPSLEENSGATNLTADELTDFFNAQQEENTPQTNEIAANPPKIGNRAVKKGPYVIPSDLLTAYKDDQYWIIDDVTKQAALNLKQTLSEFNIEAEITGIKKGPVVTMFEILPAPGVKLSKIVALQDNIALSLAAQSVRIVAPIPGKQAVGIEVPNRHRSVVGFREIIEMNLPEWDKMAVPVVLGKDILGKAQLIDLVKTPHMLIAGATGSGKSVCVNSLILSILYKRSYQDVKLILVDPKVVELKLYNNIPHLLTPVITEPKKALQALQYCLCEMERRYALLDGMGVRDISNYNAKIKEQNICTEKLPYIVVIIDEFADLMATSGKELENIVARLTAMSRAVGIHLVLATQRPSVNVITGLIKANIPTRIAFMVASRTDSNIIIDTVGAEKLLGRGDMLYASAVDPAPTRIQGTFISDQEVEDVVEAVKEYGEPDYIDDEIFVEDDEEEGSGGLFGDPAEGDDPLYDQALEIVVQSGKASASYIQRRLKIGYNRAARLVEEMEERGIVGPQNGSKPREIIHIPN